MMTVIGAQARSHRFEPGKATAYRTTVLATILVIGSALRLYHLDKSSLWYDEVVTMRLARTQSPLALMRLLHQLDATRAPLHPLMLQVWLNLCGPSDYSGRIFSALCGTLTIVMVYGLGVLAFDCRTGLWAAWLCALSPLLVYYSREARMYMWLVLLTCLAWAMLFLHARLARLWKLILYGLCLIAIVYSHPLGLLMVGALGLTSGVFRQPFQISWRSWLYTHLVVTVAVLPWLSQYLDHAPELTTGVLSFRYLLGMPIGFIGGNFITLLFCVLLIVYGQCRIQSQTQEWARVILNPDASFVCLLIWLILPPTLLYLYSHLLHPIFGPSRYTLFVGPAYLLLVAQGLSKLPLPLGLIVGIAGIFLSGVMLVHDVYRPDRYTDWKSVAAYLDQYDPHTPLVVITTGPFGNTELETARYYFGLGRTVVPWVDLATQVMSDANPIWIAIGLDDGQPVGKLSAVLNAGKVVQKVVNFPRLRLIRVKLQEASVPALDKNIGPTSPNQDQ